MTISAPSSTYKLRENTRSSGVQQIQAHVNAPKAHRLSRGAPLPTSPTTQAELHQPHLTRSIVAGAFVQLWQLGRLGGWYRLDLILGFLRCHGNRVGSSAR